MSAVRFKALPHQRTVLIALNEKSLDAETRDRHYRSILAELKLHPDDQKDLHRRGYSEEEIEQRNFKSVVKWQPLKGDYPIGLPGIRESKGFKGQQEKYLAVQESGYLCPITDCYDRIVAMQFRKRAVNEGSKYTWLSTPGTAVLNLPNGEKPLSYQDASKHGNIFDVALVEGTDLKTYLASKRLNAVAIGAVGGLFHNSSKTLKEYLTYAFGNSPANETKYVTVYPDAGDVNNPRVMNRWGEVIKCLSSLAEELLFNVRVAWWNQTEKGNHPDVDELTGKENVTFLTPEQFLTRSYKDQELVKYFTNLNEFVNNAVKKREDDEKLIEEIEKNIPACPKLKLAKPKKTPSDSKKTEWLKRKTFTPQYVLAATDRGYLNHKEFIELIDDLSKFDKRINFFINAPMGSGKTHTSQLVIKYYEDKEGTYVVVISHRNNLLFQWISTGEKKE